MSQHAESPEKRYVRLHRLIEQGICDDPMWEELSSVCFRLGYLSESLRAASRIRSPGDRRRVEAALRAKGVGVKEENEFFVDEFDPKSDHHGWKVGVSLKDANVKEEVTDGISFLFVDHIPYVVMTVTLLFPLVVSVGGTLSAGSEFWIFPIMALIPVLAIAGMVGSLSKQILMDACRGRLDAPRIGDVPSLARRAGSIARDAVITFTTLILPGLMACEFLGTIGLPVLLLGGALFPLALALCQTRDDLHGIHPKVLFPAAWALQLPGICVVGVIWALFLPALIALNLTEGSEMFLRTSTVGPLVIAPLFISARLMGRIMFLNHEVLQRFMWTTPQDIVGDNSSVKPYSEAVAESRLEALKAKSEPAKEAGNQDEFAADEGVVEFADEFEEDFEEDDAFEDDDGFELDEDEEIDACQVGFEAEYEEEYEEHEDPFLSPISEEHEPARGHWQDLERAAEAHGEAIRRQAARRQRNPALDPDALPVLHFASGPGFTVVRGEDRKALGAAANRPALD